MGLLYFVPSVLKQKRAASTLFDNVFWYVQRELNVPSDIVDQWLYTGGSQMKLLIEDLHMAKGKKPDKFQFKGYVNVDIPANQKGKVESYLTDEKQVWIDWISALQEEYGLKQSYDVQNENYRASMTCFDTQSDNYGYTLSAWASDPYKAVAVVLYKHYHIAKSKWADKPSPLTGDFG